MRPSVFFGHNFLIGCLGTWEPVAKTLPIVSRCLRQKVGTCLTMVKVDTLHNLKPQVWTKLS